MSRGYKNLLVWKKSYDLTLKIYEQTNNYPDTEKYGLISQMRRASVSITANIVEGHGKKYTGEFIKYISTSIGSCNELGLYLSLSKDLGYLSKEDYDNLKSFHNEVCKMLFGLRNSLERKKKNKMKFIIFGLFIFICTQLLMGIKLTAHN